MHPPTSAIILNFHLCYIDLMNSKRALNFIFKNYCYMVKLEVIFYIRSKIDS